jgi:hypothetical protein
MALLLEALGPEATMPEIVSGLPELITWTRNFFSLV